MVVHSQFGFTTSPSRTSPSAKYDVIRCPSAYCATSSGIAIVNIRVSTQPTLASLVRTRLQSSIGTAGVSVAVGSSASFLGTERAIQLSGGFGAGGFGGGATFGG